MSDDLSICRRRGEGRLFVQIPWRERNNDPCTEPFQLIDRVAELPPVMRSDSRWVRHGQLVNVVGKLFWFPAVEPAVAFAHAAKMSIQGWRGWDLERAAYELRYCPEHQRDEHALWIDALWHYTYPNEDVGVQLRGFVDGVLAHPHSGLWHERS